ncbi:SUMF1/EgtB/PvdO family nonheme iron enzyme [Lacinutrix sp. Hel_I_90]|uniref:SUMF1/EgtB/PvdO family nonheme iron enzyme n=1 Tax=Lacinutrix sp. Hel_I_90 TaxID=1249999 RepID=UPI0005CA5837|nr:SUMF1/EgtB/PvdO family nonheme iron enzyme [Lacinutrix sp. Hel_I_90]
MNYFLLIIYLFSISLISQNKIKKTENPPGTIRLNDSLFIDVAPIDNIMYKEFLDRSDTIMTSEVPEKLKKDKLNIIFLDATNNYSNNPAYSNYPVINITKKQAEIYCTWRTHMVKLVWSMQSKSKGKRVNYPKNISYRLPKLDEFKQAVSLFGFSKKKLHPYDKKPIYPYRLNYYKRVKKAVFLKNNLSEYTLDTIPFGSNWKKASTFNEFNDYTGFRCVCEVENK